MPSGVDRNELKQSERVMHKCRANAQALISISRKRLCNRASPETREAWQDVKHEIANHDEVLASVMVPECIYRGFCPEMHSCGYCNTEDYKKKLEAYRNLNI